MTANVESHQSRPLRWYNVILPPLLLVAGIGVAVSAHLARPEPPPVEHVAMPPLVGVQPVRSFDETLQIEADGTVVPFREVIVSAQVAGRVAERSAACETGRAVEEGELLLQLDARDYELAVERLSAELRQAEANHNETKIELDNTASLIVLAQQDLALQSHEVARLRGLVTGGSVSASELDAARRLEVSSRNALQQLQNRTLALQARLVSLEQAKQLAATQLEQARVDLQRTRIDSPVTGVVVNEHVEEDAYVQAGAALVTIEDTSAVEVRSLLRSDQVYWLWGQSSVTENDDVGTYELPAVPVTVEYQVEGNTFVWQGQLSRYDGIGLDPRTRTVPCRIVVDNPQQAELLDAAGNRVVARPPALLRGMYVSICLHLQPPAGLLRIPREALQPGGRVFKIVDQRLTVVPVRVAKSLDDCVLLYPHASLADGDGLVVTPLAAIEDGMMVRVQNEPPPSLPASTSDQVDSPSWDSHQVTFAETNGSIE